MNDSLLRHAPFPHEVVLVVVLHAAPGVIEEVSHARVHANVPVEVLLSLVKHATVVTRVDQVTPAVLHGIDVELWHANEAHLLEIPIALQPPDPVATQHAAGPEDGGT